MPEIWKDISDYEGLYQVSTLGNVKRVESVVSTSIGRTRKVSECYKIPQYVPNSNYRYVTLYKLNKGKSFNISFLVAREFLDMFDVSKPIYHIDGDINNDKVENLTQKVPDSFDKHLGLENFALLDGEIWKPVPNFEDFYEISNFGRILILAKYVNNPKGFLSIRRCKLATLRRTSLYSEYRTYKFLDSYSGYFEEWPIHRLVATLFVHNPDKIKNTYVNHKDCNKLNNNFSNLEWVTPKQNAEYASENGLLLWSNTGRKRTSSVLCLTDGEYFDSIADCAEHYNIKYANLQERLRKGSCEINGLKFKKHPNGDDKLA